MDWSIQDIARLLGTTSRTLRHYDDVGLLPPSRIGGNGYRYYDEDALAKLQRIFTRPRASGHAVRRPRQCDLHRVGRQDRLGRAPGGLDPG